MRTIYIGACSLTSALIFFSHFAQLIAFFTSSVTTAQHLPSSIAACACVTMTLISLATQVHRFLLLIEVTQIIFDVRTNYGGSVSPCSCQWSGHVQVFLQEYCLHLWHGWSDARCRVSWTRNPCVLSLRHEAAGGWTCNFQGKWIVTWKVRRIRCECGAIIEFQLRWAKQIDVKKLLHVRGINSLGNSRIAFTKSGRGSIPSGLRWCPRSPILRTPVLPRL